MYVPEVNWAQSVTNASNNPPINFSEKDKPSQQQQQWDAFIGQDNNLNDLGKQFFVNSALVIQNFVFNMPNNGGEPGKNLSKEHSNF